MVRLNDHSKSLLRNSKKSQTGHTTEFCLQFPKFEQFNQYTKTEQPIPQKSTTQKLSFD